MKAAHILAKTALQTKDELYWIENCPDSVVTIVATDCSLSHD